MKKSNKSMLIALTSTLMGVIVTAANAQQIIVNEFLRAGSLSTTNEYIELVLMQDLTAAKFSGYQFTNMGAVSGNFCAGSIITIGGDTGPAAAIYDPSNNDWAITLLTSGVNITSNGLDGNLASRDVAYVDTNGTNGDTVIETNETFNVDLSNAVGAAITDAKGVGTISNDDSVQTILGAIKSVSGNLRPSGMITYTMLLLIQELTYKIIMQVMK